jgi:hypothetical protein
MRADRVVHAESKVTDDEIVRYDRNGKWYLEPGDGQQRSMLSVNEAVTIAVAWEGSGGRIYLDRPGGALFAARAKKMMGVK